VIGDTPVALGLWLAYPNPELKLVDCVIWSGNPVWKMETVLMA